MSISLGDIVWKARYNVLLEKLEIVRKKFVVYCFPQKCPPSVQSKFKIFYDLVRNWFYIFALAVSGVALYFHALFEPFKIDNLPQIVDQPLVHSLNNLPSLFFGGIGYSLDNFDYIRFYWRPANWVLNAFFWALGNGSPFPFHAFQISIFIANGILFYLLLSKIISRGFAFVFATLFLISPANMEVADYIAILQDTLYFFFGISALCLVVYKFGSEKVRLVLLYILLFAALLGKETGVLYIPLLLLWTKLFDKNSFKVYLCMCAAVVGTYLVLRFFAAQNVYSQLIYSWSPIGTLGEKIVTVLTSVRFNIEELVLPGGFNFAANAQEHIHINSALIALSEIFAFGGVIMATGVLLKKKNADMFKAFLFFCAWFVAGILFHSQIFSLEAYVARRWLYMSTAGFYGAMGVAVYSLHKPTFRYKTILMTILFVVLVFFVSQHFATIVEVR